jgi:hypothetical protein
MVHEWAHKVACERRGIPVLEVNYFDIAGGGHVVHAEAQRAQRMIPKVKRVKSHKRPTRATNSLNQSTGIKTESFKHSPHRRKGNGNNSSS